MNMPEVQLRSVVALPSHGGRAMPGPDLPLIMRDGRHISRTQFVLQ